MNICSRRASHAGTRAAVPSATKHACVLPVETARLHTNGFTVADGSDLRLRQRDQKNASRRGIVRKKCEKPESKNDHKRSTHVTLLHRAKLPTAILLFILAQYAKPLTLGLAGSLD